jgi:hypothetical protein
LPGRSPTVVLSCASAIFIAPWLYNTPLKRAK